MKKLLILKEDEQLCLLLKRILETKGYDVLYSRNTSECVARIKSRAPDLILLDSDILLSEGFFLSKYIKNKKIMTILFINNDLSLELREKMMHLGFEKYIFNNSDLYFVLKCIRELIG